MNKIAVRNIVLIWLAWVLIVIGFQALASARFQPQWPDMTQWTPGDPTSAGSLADRPPRPDRTFHEQSGVVELGSLHRHIDWRIQ